MGKIESLQHKIGWLNDQLTKLDPGDHITKQKFVSMLTRYLTEYVTLTKRKRKTGKYQVSTDELKNAFFKGIKAPY